MMTCPPIVCYRGSLAGLTVCLLALAGSRAAAMDTTSLQPAVFESDLPTRGQASSLYAPSSPDAVVAAFGTAAGPTDGLSYGRPVLAFAPIAWFTQIGAEAGAVQRAVVRTTCTPRRCRLPLSPGSEPPTATADGLPSDRPIRAGVSDFRPVRDGEERVFGIGCARRLGPGSCRPWSGRPAVGENEPPLHLCGRRRQLDALVRHGFRPAARNRRGSCRKCRCRPIALSRPTRFRSKRSNWCRGRPTALRPTTCCRLACAERYPISPSTVTTLWKARGT